MNKKTQNKGSKKRVIAFLLMLSLVLTSGTFAYWASYVEGTSTEATGTLEVGSGDSVETRFDLTNEINSGGYLVPAGQAINSNEETAVESITISHDIKWTEDEKTTQVDGTESVGKVLVRHTVYIRLEGKVLPYEDYKNIYSLVNVTYNKNNVSELTLDADASTFSYEITLDEPANQEEYNLIANAEIGIIFGYNISTEDITTTDLNFEIDGEELPVLGFNLDEYTSFYYNEELFFVDNSNLEDAVESLILNTQMDEKYAVDLVETIAFGFYEGSELPLSKYATDEISEYDILKALIVSGFVSPAAY